MELLDFSMAHNYFWHSGAYYLQIKGVAMGAKFAPSMANLFMSKMGGRHGSTRQASGDFHVEKMN